jgi:glycosyltransferase involved in cell wall biosynthesis
MDPLSNFRISRNLIATSKNLLRRLFAKAAVRSASRVICVSEFVAQYIESWGIPKGKIDIIYHGTRLSRYSDLTSRQGSRSSTKVLLCVGSLVPYRGIEDVILALSRGGLESQGYRLEVAGGVNKDSSGYFDHLKKLISVEGVEGAVRFRGEVALNNLEKMYQEAAAVIISSRVEACPNVALEAMSAGATILSVTCKPMPEILGEAATYYRPDDWQSLAKSVRQFESGVISREVMRSKALQRAAQFTWESTASKTLASLELALQSQ